MRPVVVHGGGAAIGRAMDAAGLEPRFIQGRRYTDDATLEIVEQVLAYETNEDIAHEIEEFGGRAMPLNFRTTNVLFGERITLTDDAGNDVDLGHVGRSRGSIARRSKTSAMPAWCRSFRRCAWAPEGEKLNVNADTAATAVAQALGAEKLVFLSDVNGVRRKKDDPKTLIHSLTAAQAREMIREAA